MSCLGQPIYDNPNGIIGRGPIKFSNLFSFENFIFFNFGFPRKKPPCVIKKNYFFVLLALQKSFFCCKKFMSFLYVPSIFFFFFFTCSPPEENFIREIFPLWSPLPSFQTIKIEYFSQQDCAQISPLSFKHSPLDCSNADDMMNSLI